MATVTLVNLDVLRDRLGAAEIPLEFEFEPTIKQVVDRALEDAEAKTRRLMFSPDGFLKPSVTFVVGEERVDSSLYATYRLADQSRLTIILPIAGG